MSAPVLQYEKRDHIAYITFNRPERRNAMNPEMICRLADAWEDFNTDDDMRVALVTGAGTEAFTAGADLKTMIPLLSGAREPEDEWDFRLLADDQKVSRAATLKNSTIYKPIVAAINGPCLGAGSELLQAIDIRIAGEQASFAVNEVALGFMPGGGSAVRLARQIPYCMAMQFLLVADKIGAEDAHRMGFVNEVVPVDEVLARAQWYAERIAANGPLAVRKTKETVLRTLGLSWEEAYEVEAENCVITMGSEDAKEGPLAFAEKRMPRFTGK
ncbi:MAG: enoyl-CoA hydratase/isomerase family protein [Porticoccaceae bacterium]|nr:enoyl-CoA hydratase/isomerase family protein [Porticoccaceae bacterium]